MKTQIMVTQNDHDLKIHWKLFVIISIIVQSKENNDTGELTRKALVLLTLSINNFLHVLVLFLLIFLNRNKILNTFKFNLLYI